MTGNQAFRSADRPMRYRKLATAVATICAATSASTTWAQDQQLPTETVLVTGSYIERAADRPTPGSRPVAALVLGASAGRRQASWSGDSINSVSGLNVAHANQKVSR